MFSLDFALGLSRIARTPPSLLPKGELLRAYVKLGIQSRAMRHLPGAPAALKIFGYRVAYLDYQSFARLFDGIFLRQQYYFCSRKPDPLIVDGGSNIGMAVLYFKKIYPECRVIAFEPCAKAFDKLACNVMSNNLSPVSLYRKAIHDEAGTVLVFQGENDPGSLRTSTRRERVWGDKKATPVEAVLLSDYIVEQIDLLKLDIEGSEARVLQELAGHGKLEMIRQLIVEYHHHVRREEDGLSNLLGLLERHGFGYQVRADFALPHRKASFQDVLIYAYQKSELDAGERSARRAPAGGRTSGQGRT